MRRDFAEFVHAGPAFDLYILSLRAFAQQNQTSLLSYYQVAGEEKNSIWPLQNPTDKLKVSMVILSSHGMESRGNTTSDTVLMGPFFFPSGTARIWLCLRYV